MLGKQIWKRTYNKIFQGEGQTVSHRVKKRRGHCDLCYSGKTSWRMLQFEVRKRCWFWLRGNGILDLREANRSLNAAAVKESGREVWPEHRTQWETVWICRTGLEDGGPRSTSWKAIKSKVVPRFNLSYPLWSTKIGTIISVELELWYCQMKMMNWIYF